MINEINRIVDKLTVTSHKPTQSLLENRDERLLNTIAESFSKTLSFKYFNSYENAPKIKENIKEKLYNKLDDLYPLEISFKRI